MNLNIIPIERCFVHFEYYKRSGPYDPLCKRINWLGFDKYKFLIYGIHDVPKFRDEVEINEKEIVMLSVCEMKISVIKRLHLQSQMPITHIGSSEEAAISSAGNEIAIVRFYCPNRNSDGDEPKLVDRFYMFSTETGEIQTYRLFCDSTKVPTNYFFITYCLYHSSSLGWIFVNMYIDIVTDENDLYVIEHVVFDDSNKTCKLEYVTATFIRMPNPVYTFFGEKNALFLSPKGDCINVYDYQNKSWITKKLYNFPNTSPNFICWFVEHEQDIICLTFPDFVIDDVKDCSLYRLVGDQWEKLSLSLTYQNYCDSPRSGIERCFRSYNLFFLSHLLTDTSSELPGKFDASDGEGKQLKRKALCVTVNVVSLKLLAMRQVVVNYKKLCAEHLLEEVDFPHILRRQFFGPSWIQKGIYK